MRLATRWVAVGLIAGLTGACDMIDRARGTGQDADRAGGVTLSLESPGTVEAGVESAIRLSVWNRGDTAVTAVRALLFLPGWLQPLPPTHEGAAVTMVSSAEGTQLSYPIAEPALQPGETRTVVQPVRVAPAGESATEVGPSRTLRAWLVGADGRPVGSEVSTDLAVTGMPEGPGADVDGDGVVVGADAVGRLRLGMTAAEARARFPQARDTSWMLEGMRQPGLVVDLAGDEPAATAGGLVLARLDGERIDQIRVRQRGPRTAEGLGVGSTLDELRAAYGEPCVAAGEVPGTVVWFEQRPGVSFVLDTAADAAARRDPARLQGSATVQEMFVHARDGRC